MAAPMEAERRIGTRRPPRYVPDLPGARFARYLGGRLVPVACYAHDRRGHDGYFNAGTNR